MRRTIASGHIPLNSSRRKSPMFRPRLRHNRKGSSGNDSSRDASFDWSCLFPREQGVTGINPSVLPASLTGRIWFFCETVNHQQPNCFESIRLAALTPLAMFPRLGGRCPMLRLRARGHRPPCFRITAVISVVRGIHPDERVRWRCRTLTRIIRALCLRPLERQFPAATFAADHLLNRGLIPISAWTYSRAHATAITNS